MSSSVPLVKQGWLRVILFILLFMLVGTILGFTLQLVYTNLISESFRLQLEEGVTEDIGLLLSQIAMVIITGLSVLVARKFIDRQSFASLGWSLAGRGKDIGVGLGLGLAIISFGFIVLYGIGFLQVVDVHFSIPTILFYLLLCTIISFSEELIMRGYILPNLMDSFDKYIALVISALLFGLLHVFNPSVTVISLINITLAGVLLGIYYIHQRNLWFPIALHFSWNFFQGPIFGFEVSGIDMQSVIQQEINGYPLLTGGEFGLEGSILITFIQLGLIVWLDHSYKKEGNITRA